MTDHTQRKQQLIARGAIYRAQVLNADSAIRKASDIKVLVAQARSAAYAAIREQLHLQQKKLQEIMPVALEKISTVSGVSVRYMRKPVLCGAMVLGAVSALPRFFKGGKSNDQN